MMMTTKQARLTAATLRSTVTYDKQTGQFLWLSSAGGVKLGALCGCVSSNGYVVFGLLGRKYRAHRLAWLYVHGVWPSETIDHIDGNRSNNAIENLRCVPQRINNQNQTRPGRANASGLLGVYWSPRLKGYMAQVSVLGKKKRRGPYKDSGRAYSAYVALKRAHHEGCTL